MFVFQSVEESDEKHACDPLYNVKPEKQLRKRIVKLHKETLDVMVAVADSIEQEEQRAQRDRLQEQGQSLFLRKRPLEEDDEIASDTETPVDRHQLMAFHLRPPSVIILKM